MNENVTISTDRYEQLIRAEHDANLLKAAIADYYGRERPLFRDQIETLFYLFIGKKEEE